MQDLICLYYSDKSGLVYDKSDLTLECVDEEYLRAYLRGGNEVEGLKLQDDIVMYRDFDISWLNGIYANSNYIIELDDNTAEYYTNDMRYIIHLEIWSSVAISGGLDIELYEVGSYAAKNSLYNEKAPLYTRCCLLPLQDGLGLLVGDNIVYRVDTLRMFGFSYSTQRRRREFLMS